jgi:AcrR family transcriptional regulator
VDSAFDQLLERTDDSSGIAVRRVAERAGVGIGSLYDYFTSRENLFGELVVRLTDDNFRTWARACSPSRTRCCGTSWA